MTPPQERQKRFVKPAAPHARPKARKGAPRVLAPAVPARDPLLATVGAQVRRLRDERGQTRRELAGSSGLSERFLADLEGGVGNISLQKLEQVGRALGSSSASLLNQAEDARLPRGGPQQESQARAGPQPELPESLRGLLVSLTRDELAEAQRWLKARFGGGNGPLIALLGLRGAGKSTIGRRLAQRFSVPFVELDALVERAAGLSLSGIFSLHGEAYYRRLAREVLTRFLAESEAAVLATGGSVVTDREAFRLLLKRCRTVWLQATPEDHWQRVLEQGDERPGAASATAQVELRALLKAREPLYAQSELTVDTSRLGVAGAVEEIARQLETRAIDPAAQPP